MASPSSIGSCIHWWDATVSGSITLVDDKVSAWNDLVGSANFAQSDAARRPVLDTMGPNGLTTIKFADDWLDAAGVNQADPLTIIVGFREDTNTASYKLLDGITSRVLFQVTGGNFSLWAGNSIDAASGPTTGTPHVWLGEYNNGASGARLRVDGTTLVTDSSSPYMNGTLTGLRIGSRNGSPPTFDHAPASIGEVAVFSEILSAEDMAAMESYFTRWTVEAVAADDEKSTARGTAQGVATGVAT